MLYYQFAFEAKSGLQKDITILIIQFSLAYITAECNINISEFYRLLPFDSLMSLSLPHTLSYNNKGRQFCRPFISPIQSNKALVKTHSIYIRMDLLHDFKHFYVPISKDFYNRLSPVFIRAVAPV